MRAKWKSWAITCLKMEENILVSQIVCHTFLCSSQPRPMWLANGNMGHAQVIGIILCSFPNCPIIYPVGTVYYFQITLPTPFHRVPSNVMLVFKKFTSEPLEHSCPIFSRITTWMTGFRFYSTSDT